MDPSTFKGIDFVKVDISNKGNFDKNLYRFTNEKEKIGEVEYFYRISKYPITNKIYNRYLLENNFTLVEQSNNFPVVNINFLDACVFCNWLTTGSNDDGTYKIVNSIPKLVSRNGYYLPNENEWHKAAFFNPSLEKYFLYATGSNEPPKQCNTFSLEKNLANYLYNYRTEDSLLKKNHDHTLNGKLTPVGSFLNSFSPFGTYDQNGNVWEVVDTADEFIKCIKGGSAFSSVYSLNSTFSSVCSINTRSRDIGFRVCRGF